MSLTSRIQSRQIFSWATGLVSRFPIPLVAITMNSLLFLFFIGSVRSSGSIIPTFDARWLGVSLWLFPTSLLVNLCAERSELSTVAKHFLSALFCVLSFALGTYWVYCELSPLEFASRVTQFMLFIHLMIAVLPVLAFTEESFYQFNRFLFWRFFYLALFAGVLTLGIYVGMLMCTNLLSIKFGDEAYSNVAVVIFLFLHPLVFLSGLKSPSHFGAQKERSTENEFLVRYILSPLVGLYLVILYSYAMRILFRWELPRGQVGYLVTGVSLLGILCFLLFGPLLDTHRRIRRFRTVFFVLLLPLLGLLFVGLYTRVANYGWTEERYLLAVLAAWLFAVSIFFSIRKKTDLRIVPVSLGSLCFITLVGPWSAYELPPYLQRKALEKFLEEKSCFENGRISCSGIKISVRESNELRTNIKYLCNTSQKKVLREWVLPKRGDLELELLARLKIETDFERAELLTRKKWDSDYSVRPSPVKVTGYDQIVHIQTGSYRQDFEVKIDEVRFSVLYKKRLIAEFDLSHQAIQLLENRSISNSRRIELKALGKQPVKFLLEAFSVLKEGESVKLEDLRGYLLYFDRT